jgi:hypothetical protein
MHSLKAIFLIVHLINLCYFRTVAKVSVMGSDYISQLTAKDIDISQLPAAIGGRYPVETQEGVPFVFDYEREDSLLYMPDTRVLAIPTPVPSEPGTEDDTIQ